MKRFFQLLCLFVLSSCSRNAIYSKTAPSWVNAVRSGSSSLRVDAGDKILFRSNHKGKRRENRSDICSAAIEKNESYIRKAYPFMDKIPMTVELTFYDPKLNDCSTTISVPRRLMEEAEAAEREKNRAKRNPAAKEDCDKCRAVFETVNWKTVTVKQIEDAVKKGEPVNARDRFNNTPLMAAVKYNENPDVVRAMINAGADANARNNDGWTVLMVAVLYNGNPAVAETLIKAGADVNARTKEGYTPLMIAMNYSKNSVVVETLIKAGADAVARDNSGKTALDYAKQNPNPKIREMTLSGNKGPTE